MIAQRSGIHTRAGALRMGGTSRVHESACMSAYTSTALHSPTVGHAPSPQHFHVGPHCMRTPPLSSMGDHWLPVLSSHHTPMHAHAGGRCCVQAWAWLTHRSQVKGAPVAAMTSTTAFVISGPIPSPGISVTCSVCKQHTCTWVAAEPARTAWCTPPALSALAQTARARHRPRPCASLLTTLFSESPGDGR